LVLGIYILVSREALIRRRRRVSLPIQDWQSKWLVYDACTRLYG